MPYSVFGISVFRCIGFDAGAARISTFGGAACSGCLVDVVEKPLQLDVWCLARISENFQAGDASVTIENDEGFSLSRNKRWRVNLARLYDVFCQISHMLFSLIEQPSNCGSLVFKFAMTVIRPVDPEVRDRQ
jgi:hypothetical protein